MVSGGDWALKRVGVCDEASVTGVIRPAVAAGRSLSLGSKGWGEQGVRLSGGATENWAPQAAFLQGGCWVAVCLSVSLAGLN